MKVEDHIPSIASCSFPAKQMYNLSHSSPHFCYGILFVVHVNQSWFYSVSIVLIRSSNITTEYQALCICYDMPFKAFDFFAPFYCLMTLLSRVINGLSTSSKNINGASSHSCHFQNAFAAYIKGVLRQ
jgi:hypothetical protein